MAEKREQVGDNEHYGQVKALDGPVEQDHLSNLLGLFAQLNLSGVTEHDFVDYLFVRTKVRRLCDLTPEMIEKYTKILIDMQGNEKTKMEFRKFLLEIQAKLQRSAWEAFKGEVK